MKAFAPLRCDRWTCKHCADDKAIRWGTFIQKAEPNIMLTLTRPAHEHRLIYYLTTDQDEQRRRIAKDMAELFKIIRRHKAPALQYWGVLAPHQSGVLHAHLLLQSPFIPRKWLSARAAAVGWGTTHISTINRGWSAGRYCAKHLTGERARQRPGRIRYSHNFFPQEVVDDMQKVSYGWWVLKCGLDAAKEAIAQIPAPDLTLDTNRWLDSGLVAQRKQECAII